MQAVGIRELKAKLSHYVRIAKTGEVVLVTEHGKVVAALGPPSATRLPPELAGLQSLVDRGIVTLGGPKRPGVYVSTGLKSAPGTAQALIDEIREDN
jgi:prevent-host-death family protein